METPFTIDEFITQIRNWYNSDYKGFKTLFDKAVVSVLPIPPETSPSVMHNWKNATIDQLCNFFMEWYKWLPDVSTGLQYIQKFSWLYYKNPYELCFVTTGAGLEMTKQFVILRGMYMDSKESVPLAQKWEKEL